MVAALLAACAPAVQSAAGHREATPSDVFSCYLRTLTTMDYVVEESDRDGGLIRAVLEDGGLMAGEYGNLATVLIVPSESDGADVTVTIRRARRTDGGWSTAGMAMNSSGQADLERLTSACPD